MPRNAPRPAASQERALLVLAVAVTLVLAPPARPAGAHTPAEGTEPAADGVPRPGDAVTLPAGTELRLLASRAAPVVVRLGGEAEAEVVDVHRTWLRVRSGGDAGWVEAASLGGSTAAPAQGGTESQRDGAGDLAGDSLAARRASVGEADGEIERIRRRLGDAARTHALGPVELLTDLDDPTLLHRLDRLAREVTDLHHRRYGLPVPRTGDERPGPSAGTLVLLRGPRDTGLPGDPTAADPRLAGHTRGRLATVHAGRRTAVQTARLVVHELGHLLLRHALGPAPPAWLDEGVAGDLEMFPLSARLRLLEISPETRALRRGDRFRHHGPLVALERLVADAGVGRLESLPALLAMTPADLRDPQRGAERYALAALWVRYLLDGADGAHAEPFRAWLGRLSSDGPAAAGPLLPHLGGDPATLERDFHLWLATLADRLRPTP